MEIAEIPVMPRFVVFEGADGAGTTTQLKMLDAALDAMGEPHWTTSEPTGGPVGQLIRKVLGGELHVEPGTLAYLFATDRHEHLNGANGILEHLGRGDLVICDRYVLSSLAYQGSTCGSELPLTLNRAFPLPELLFFFDVEPSLSLSRLASRDKREIYENLPFLERVRQGYADALACFAGSAMQVHTLNAALPVHDIHQSILLRIRTLIRQGSDASDAHTG
ncbi:MAG TPA: dTMP kinase [Rectinemataceae bacterium]|nr:dTMP kinase [Rectinemataceae bacterium]